MINAGNIDNSLVTAQGFNSTTSNTVTQPDGKIIIVGAFQFYRTLSYNRIVRINTDGTIDTTFVVGTGFNSEATTILLQPDGKIIVAGGFTTYQGVSASRICRLNSDGSRDTTFDVGVGFSSVVHSIALQSDGKILAGGFYTEFQGVSANRIIRLNSNGSRDTTFDIGVGFNSTVRVINILPNGVIIVGGQFNLYKSLNYNRLIFLNPDGSIFAGFAIGSGFNSSVRTIKVLANGRIIIGGDFTTYAGVTVNRIVQILGQGTRDTSFDVGTGFNNSVWSIDVDDNNRVIVVGDFITYQGVTANRIARLLSNGNRDTSFEGSFDNRAHNVIIQPDNKLLVCGGFFSEYNTVTANGLVRISSGVLTYTVTPNPIIFGFGVQNNSIVLNNTSNSTINFLYTNSSEYEFINPPPSLTSGSSVSIIVKEKTNVEGLFSETLTIRNANNGDIITTNVEVIITCLNNYSIGGIQRIYIAQWNNTFSANYDNREIMSFSDFDSTWYELPNNTINSFNQSYNKNAQGIYMSSNLSITLQNDGTIDWEDMVFILDKRWVIVLKDNNGRYWVFGRYNGATSDVIGRSTGELNGGNNTFTIVFTDVNGESVLSGINKNYVINNIL